MFTAQETRRAHAHARIIAAEVGCSYRVAYSAACKIVAADKRASAKRAWLRLVPTYNPSTVRDVAAAALVTLAAFAVAPMALAATL